jgi:phosphoribosylformylglycinamidine synthase
MLGLLEDYRLRVPSAFPGGGLAVYLLGDTLAELGGSEFAGSVLGEVAGRPPMLDLEAERSLHGLLGAASRATLLRSAHDCGDGGLAVTIAECAIGAGNGCAVGLPGDLPPHILLFSESASRAVVSVDPADEEAFVTLAAEHGVPCARVGETGGPRVMINGVIDVTVEELVDAWSLAIPRLLGEAS